MALITVEIPDHLVEDFYGWMSNQGESDLYEAYKNGDGREDTFVSVSYPGWTEGGRIVITEHE